MLKYQGVVDDVVTKVAKGVYKPNDRLPTTNELCEQYGVSKITIKKAMDELEARGLVARRRGSGTYVKSIVPKNVEYPEGWSMSSQMAGFKREHEMEGQTVTTKVYEFSVEHPSPKIAERLAIEQDEFVYRVCRVRCSDGQPLVIEHTWMPITVIPDLRMRHLETSVYDYIEEGLGLKISSAHRVVSAVLVPEDECEKLDVEPGTPALQVEQVGFLDDGIAFEYSISRHVRDYKFYSISTH